MPRPRGRPSAVSQEARLASERNESPGRIPAFGRRVTRSSSSLNPSTTASTPSSVAKHPRGRPSKASLLTLESGPSASTSADFTSPSEYSTPATSTEPTPAPSGAADASSKRLRSSTTSHRLEVQIPNSKRASNPKDSRRGRYSMNPASRKSCIPDSEDDEDIPPTTSGASAEKASSVKATRRGRYSMTSASKATQIADSDEEEQLSDVARDEIVAGRLQNEEYQRANLSASPDEAPTFTAPRKRGRPSKTTVAEQKRPAKKAKVQAKPGCSDEADEDVESSALSSDFVVDDSEDDDSFVDGASGSDARPSAAAKGKSVARPKLLSRRTTSLSAAVAMPASSTPAVEGSDVEEIDGSSESSVTENTPLPSDSGSDTDNFSRAVGQVARNRHGFARSEGRRATNRSRLERDRLETSHPELKTMWKELEDKPKLNVGKAVQPKNITRQLKDFQLEGLAWMKEMEKQEWKGGLLGDEMGLGKTIQAVSLIMSDWPAKQPTLILVPPVALMQWSSEIASYTDGTLNTFVFHGTNTQSKSMTVKKLKQYDVIMMSYNSLESMYRRQEKGLRRGNAMHKEKSMIHQIRFHRVLLDEAHCIKTRTTMTAKACFALNVEFRWCLTGTPLQNRIGEFFSLIRFLNVQPFASYLCKQCPCSTMEWSMNEDSRCSHCGHAGMQHVSVFNQELLNPIQKYGNIGPGAEAFSKLRLMTDRIMLRRLKKDHTSAMDLPVKEIQVDRQFFGEVENDFANSIMTNNQRRFETYVAQGVLLNNYANIFGLIMQMRQVADHPDLLLKKTAEGGQNVLVCCICDEPAEDAIRSRCKHDFCRACAKGYLNSSDEPDCPQCHIPLSIDLEQPEMEQDENLVKKSSIINRIKMENWTSSSKIELLVRDLHKLRSDKASHKSIIFSQFTSMLQLIEWRLRRAGVTTVMLDGSMTPAQRQASIDHFMKTPEVECFLVSLKAGGVALNLTEASRVFIVDPWWNPAAEWQSADRCHRIGQTRPCNITRLCIEDSVESRMVLIQEKKTNMIHSTVNADDKAMESLSPQDMQFLFRGS